MKKSRKITLTVLAGLTLTGCLAAAGCGGRGDDPEAVAEPDEAPDHTWYDENGNAVPERWRLDERGDRVLDAEGRPIPEPGPPYDRNGRVWVYHSGGWVPPIIVLGRAAYYRSGPVRPVMGGGVGYRGPNTVTPYRAPAGAGPRPVVTPPPAARPPSPPPRPTGGFGGTGAAMSSGGAS